MRTHRLSYLKCHIICKYINILSHDWYLKIPKKKTLDGD